MTVPARSYIERFTDAARRAGFDESYIEACSSYASNLIRRDLPVIFDRRHLAALLGLDEDFLRGVSYSPRGSYRHFTVVKRSGGSRLLSEPLPLLKSAQKWILTCILERLPVSPYAKAFKRGLSVKDGARFHTRKQLVLTVDVEDFFPSIRRPKIYSLFRASGYSRDIADLLSRLCCLNDSLPQGAPTSPALSNLVCRRLDARIAGYAKARNLRYTRYADDITVSGSLVAGDVLRFLRLVLGEEGLMLHPHKIRVQGRHQRQLVTGLTVNEGVRVPRDVRRHLRAVAHIMEKFGVQEASAALGQGRANVVEHFASLAGYVRHIRADSKSSRIAESFQRFLSESRTAAVSEIEEG